MCLPYVHTIIKYRSVVGVFHGFGEFHKTNFKVVAEYFLRGTTKSFQYEEFIPLVCMNYTTRSP